MYLKPSASYRKEDPKLYAFIPSETLLQQVDEMTYKLKTTGLHMAFNNEQKT